MFPKVLIEGDQTEIRELRSQKQELTMSFESIKADYEKANSVISKLREELKTRTATFQQLKSQILNLDTVYKTPKTEIKMYKHGWYEVNKNGGSRVVLQHDQYLYTSTNIKTLFGDDYRLQKIDIHTLSGAGTLVNHTKPIRDAKTHRIKNIIGTTSMDCSFKLTDLTSNTLIDSFRTDSALWCCEFDINNEYLVHIGRQRGAVTTMDMRNMAEPLDTQLIADEFSPVVSLNSIKTNSVTPHGALLCCKLNSAWCITLKTNEFEQYCLPIEGPFMSSSYQHSNDHIIVSCRPSVKHLQSRHVAFTLAKTREGINSDIIHTFPGSFRQTQLSRSCMFSYKGDYVAAYNESLHNISLYSLNSGDLAYAFHSSDSIVDICHFKIASDNFLACLSDKKLQINRLLKDD